MVEIVNAVYAVTFAVGALLIAGRITARLRDFLSRRRDIATPALLWRDAIFWLALMPFAGTVLLARLIEPLRDFLRGNPGWQLVTGGLIVVGVLVWLWYEYVVIGRSARAYDDRERGNG